LKIAPIEDDFGSSRFFFTVVVFSSIVLISLFTFGTITFCSGTFSFEGGAGGAGTITSTT